MKFDLWKEGIPNDQKDTANKPISEQLGPLGNEKTAHK